MKHTKILLHLDEQDYMSNYHGEINIQIYKELINMGLCEYIFFEKTYKNLQIDEKHIVLGYGT
jgi:hypothetical protein